jgi:arginine deiminase
MGVETIEASSLLAEALAQDTARDWILERLPGLSPMLHEEMRCAAPEQLASMLVAGVLPAMAHRSEMDDLYEIPPLPNWCFQRDPQVVLGESLLLASMAAPARRREAVLARALFQFHPALSGVPVAFDPDASLEGGDVLVLSPEVIAVGQSQRTDRAAVLELMRALARREQGPRWLLAVELPHRRAYMHLDTVLTPIDRDACLGFPPVLRGRGTEGARVFEADLHATEPSLVPCGDLLEALARRGVDLDLVPCGGEDPVAQRREQWTDGANALAVAPGVILLYDRNVRTVEELDRRGFRIVLAEDLLLGRDEVDPGAGGRTCILLASHEISRARGGPHCLTHPLLRDDC